MRGNPPRAGWVSERNRNAVGGAPAGDKAGGHVARAVDGFQRREATQRDGQRADAELALLGLQRPDLLFDRPDLRIGLDRGRPNERKRAGWGGAQQSEAQVSGFSDRCLKGMK
jgi:hypothetical protein